MSIRHLTQLARRAEQPGCVCVEHNRVLESHTFSSSSSSCRSRSSRAFSSRCDSSIATDRSCIVVSVPMDSRFCLRSSSLSDSLRFDVKRLSSRALHRAQHDHGSPWIATSPTVVDQSRHSGCSFQVDCFDFPDGPTLRRESLVRTRDFHPCSESIHLLHEDFFQ